MPMLDTVTFFVLRAVNSVPSGGALCRVDEITDNQAQEMCSRGSRRGDTVCPLVRCFVWPEGVA